MGYGVLLLLFFIHL